MTVAHPDHPARAVQIRLPDGHPWQKLPLFAGGVAAAGFAVSAILGLRDTPHFFFAYLATFVYFLTFALGGLFFVLIQFATRSGWSVVVRRVAENVMGTLPVFAVLFIPVILGVRTLYPWSDPAFVSSHEGMSGKTPWLNAPFFLIRAAVYFAVWIGASRWLLRLSVSQDETGDKQITRCLQAASGALIVASGLTATFASFDWLMSLDPLWSSTMYGVYFFSGTLVAIFSLLAVLTILMRRSGILADAITPEHLHDEGKLLWAFVIFWAYIAFSQYFLIWYANIPEETAWFAGVWKGPWKSVSVLLALGHFIVPLYFFMPRFMKRIPAALFGGACWMLVMHYIDIYWLVMPAFDRDGAHFGILEIALLIGFGGLFVSLWSLGLKKRALLPYRDPRLPESLAFEND